MLGRTGTGYAKTTSKFEDSDSHMSRPRSVSELPHRPAPRVPPRLRTAAEASGAHHRALGAGRGTSPRSPLHEKKPAGSGAGAGSKVAELEAKLGKAQDQLAEMREQLAAAEKTRKDACGAFVEAKKRFAAKKRDVIATSVPVEDDVHDVPAQQKQQAEVVTADVTNGGNEETRSRSSPSPATGVLEPIVPESENRQAQTTGDDDEVNNIAIVADGDGKNGNQVADQLRTKLVAQDEEVYELRAKLMVRDVELDELRVKLTAKDTDVDELTAKLLAKDAEIAALRADNADLMKIAEEASEASEAVKETAAKAGEIEHALRESAAREARIAERLRASERAQEALEAEIQRSRVQSEQWRKAAEEAAAVLGGVGHHVGAVRGAKDRRRRHSSAGSNGGACDRMDKQDADDVEGSGGKRKSTATGGGAMRVLTDLWKKKVHK